MAPTLACIGPSGEQTTLFPVAEWSFGADLTSGAEQGTVTVDVFDASTAAEFDFDPTTATPVLTATTGDATDRSLPMPTALGTGSYVAYISATDADGVAAEPCSTDFSVVVSVSPAARPVTAVGGKLGCGEYVVRIQDRGGDPVRTELEWQSLSYGRKVDDMSDARVTVGADGLADEECCQALSGLQAWKHEISIWRDGVEAWVGVVGDPEYTADGVTIPARDLFQWMERRNLEHDRTFTGVDLALVFRQYVLDALDRDTSPNITVELYTSGAIGDRSIVALARRRAADELRELARTGVDFTMIGRRMLVGGEELPLSPLPPLTEAVIDDPRLTVRGLDAASEVIVVGSTDENSDIPHSGVARAVSSEIGLVQVTVSESSIKDDDSCESAAQSRVDLLSGTAEFLDVTLLPEATVDFADLIPGTRWPVGVRVACREVAGTFRLAEVRVDASVSDQGDTETVRVLLEPLGTTDED